MGDRVSFSVAAADALPAAGYDLVTCFDCLHDMGDPAAVARHVRSALAPGGTWMIVEPRAGDSVPERPLERSSSIRARSASRPTSIPARPDQEWRPMSRRAHPRGGLTFRKRS